VKGFGIPSPIPITTINMASKAPMIRAAHRHTIANSLEMFVVVI
jgi:hypothetical protein